MKPKMAEVVELIEESNIASKPVKFKAKQYADDCWGELYSSEPRSVAAASVYAAGLLENEKKTQREIANEFGVVEATVRRNYELLIEELGINKNPRSSPVLGPQWNQDCPDCGATLSGVWPSKDAERVEVETCYKCGGGPVVVERELDG